MLFVFIWLIAKGPNMAIQSVLHVLFLPTPFKRALANALASADPSGAPTKPKDDDDIVSTPSPARNKAAAARVEDLFTEVVKPGALYRECSIVTLNVPPLPPPPTDEDKAASSSSDKKDKKKGKDAKDEANLDIEDDGEFGGESLGRVVWEWYEQSLKAWEAEEKRKAPEAGEAEAQVEQSSEATKQGSS